MRFQRHHAYLRVQLSSMSVVTTQTPTRAPVMMVSAPIYCVIKICPYKYRAEPGLHTRSDMAVVPHGWILFVTLSVITVFVLSVTLPLTLLMAPANVPLAVLVRFGQQLHYQHQLCPCRVNDTQLATNERAVSNAMFKQVQSSDPDPRGLSGLAIFWGQFIDHDIVRSAQDPALGNFSIRMEPSDAILKMTRNVHRVAAGGCRESANFNTPYIDATTVYGDDDDRLALLKPRGACRLTMSNDGGMLPLQPNGREFWAGDPRATEHSFLASLHTLWAREHNRLCDVLVQMRPEWSDEQRFWKARQVVIAKIQHITYDEWLPALLGSQMHLLDDVRMRLGNAEIAQAFSVSVYRFGHSMIPDPIGPFTLPSLFFNAQLLIDNGVEPFLQSAFHTPAQRCNLAVVDGLRDFLFAAGPHVIGEDLVSRNLFREREVGIGSYGDIRACYGLSAPTTSPDVDSYTGILQEPLVAGSSVGETIGVVVAEQFKRLRAYDSNFYTRSAYCIGSFFNAEIAQTTLATVIEANTALTNVPAHVFYKSP